MAEMTLAGLRVVFEVDRSGSFTTAAETLGYTQSAVSRQVAAMEAAAGTPLFVRGARGVQPTPAGAVLARHAGDVLARIEAAEHELAGLHDYLAGRLSVSAYPTAAAVLVPRAMARLMKDHPAVTVTLREESSPTQLRRLRAGRSAVAVVADGAGLPQYDYEGLNVVVLTEGGELCVAVATTHRLARRDRVDVDDLEGETWVAGDRGGADPQFSTWPTLTGTAAGSVAHIAKAWPTRLGLVATGLGICVLPRLAAASVPAGVKAIAVDDPSYQPRRTLALTLHDATTAAQAMVQALRRETARMLNGDAIPSSTATRI